MSRRSGESVEHTTDEISEVSKGAMRIGKALTVVWLIFIGVLVFCVYPEKWKALDPNELGDFIAGVSAPLAFLWLVVGIWQQGEDLKIQRADLRHGMKMTRDIAETARAQHELDVGGAQPRFSGCYARQRAGNVWIFECFNAGATAHNVRVIENRSTASLDEQWRASKIPHSPDRMYPVMKSAPGLPSKTGWIRLGYMDQSQANQQVWAYLTDDRHLHFREYGEGPLDDESELQQWLAEIR